MAVIGGWNSLRVLGPERRCAALLRNADEHRLLRCGWCREDLTRETAEIDHVVPRSRGGGDGPDNLVGCCSFCNQDRRHPRRFRRRLAEVGLTLEQAEQSVRAQLALTLDLEAGAALARVWYPWLMARRDKNRAAQRRRDEAKRARWRAALADPSRLEFPFGAHAGA